MATDKRGLGLSVSPEFLQLCHSLGGVKVVLRGPGMVLTACMPSACGKIV
jgi:hypothetical protein